MARFRKIFTILLVLNFVGSFLLFPVIHFHQIDSRTESGIQTATAGPEGKAHPPNCTLCFRINSTWAFVLPAAFHAPVARLFAFSNETVHSFASPRHHSFQNRAPPLPSPLA